MTNALTIIEKKLTAPETTRQLALTLGLDPENEKESAKAFKFASSVLAEVKKTAGDAKKDLTVCQPDSIVQAMIDAAQYQLAIDGRQLAHLVKYGNRATFMPGYRAYLYKIKQHYPDADFTIECIFEGDDVKIWADEDGQHYTLAKKSDPFKQDIKAFRGVLFAVSYTDKGRLITKVMAVPRDRIDRARKAAKQDYIWSSDYFEKAKAAAIKNACKTLFTSIQGLQDMARADNEANYDVDRQPAAPERKSVVDNINASLAGEPDEIIDAEVIDVEPEPEVDTAALKAAGDDAASQGMAAFKAWANSISEAEKAEAGQFKTEWVEIARGVDEQNEEIPL